MAEKSEEKKKFNPDDRFRFIGFEVFPGKVGDLFKSDQEKEEWVEKVKAKKEKGGILRERCTLTEERVAGYEKIVMTITSVLLVATLFLPWFSGYKEITVEAGGTAAATQNQAAEAMPSDSAVMTGMPGDSAAMAGMSGEAVPAGTTGTAAAGQGTMANQGGEETTPSSEVVLEKDEAGFASITATRKRKEIRREPVSISAIGAIASLGDIGGKLFSSGVILVITGILMIAYMLFAVAMAVYMLYILYGTKGDPDQQALKIKKAVRYNWAGLAIWFVMFFISFFGASYSFDTSDMIVQLGGSYGPGTFLGLLSFGFYISLACFIMNAVKGSEI